MARYGKRTQRLVASALRRRRRGTLRSGKSRKLVRSRKQAIAIGLSEARRKGAKVPPAPTRRSRRRRSPRKKR